MMPIGKVLISLAADRLTRQPAKGLLPAPRLEFPLVHPRSC
jgi:hypothetical protein